MLDKFIQQYHLPLKFERAAKQFFIPIADEIHQQVTATPFFFAINGCQGSGKSTLANFLASFLQQTHGYKVAVLSLDDFYLSQNERNQLADKVHPLFKTRGVPGTHNISLLTHTLDCLARRETIALPRFNKALDNPTADSLWPKITSADIIIFEGWCWGTHPQEEHDLLSACNALEHTYDSEGIWRRYANQQLKQHYVPLYDYMNHWLMLQAPSFSCVAEWRWQQEQQLAKQNTTSNRGMQIMSQPQISQFVQYFERLTEHSLHTLPAWCDTLLALDHDRQITTLRKKT